MGTKYRKCKICGIVLDREIRFYDGKKYLLEPNPITIWNEPQGKHCTMCIRKYGDREDFDKLNEQSTGAKWEMKGGRWVITKQANIKSKNI